MNLRTCLTSLATLLLLAPLSACQPSIGNATEGDGEADGDDTNEPTGAPTSGPEGEGFTPCSASNPCPDGLFCFNGLCALGCTNNADCAEDQYCDTEFDMLCHNKTVSSCPEVACPEGQQCVDGFCSAGASEASCEQMPNGEDGCAKDALCISESEEDGGKCYTFPACAEDDTCPKGTSGAVCNVDIITSKSRICLVGGCLDAEQHCPADQVCVLFDGVPIGSCSTGTFGSPCNGAADCKSGTCSVLFPGQPGFCE